VRHGRRADFAGLDLLLEEAERDVAPDVAIEVDQDAVGAGEGVEQLGQRVVRLDLDGVGVEGQAERLDEALGEAFPVVAGVGGRWAL
jgi:glutathione S-transferase